MSLLGSLFKTTDALDSNAISSPLELVTYAASLASNPADIDPFLDPVRKITATHSIDAGLSPVDEVEVLTVYQELETYLMTRDPIRTFTKEELRNKLNPELASKLTEHETEGGI